MVTSWSVGGHKMDRAFSGLHLAMFWSGCGHERVAPWTVVFSLVTK